MKVKKFLLNLAAPLSALAFAFALSAIFLVIGGLNPGRAFADMFDYGFQTESIVSSINRALPLYISAMAVAIGFKMGLFNIGVEGQYQIAALIAAWVAGAIALPPYLHIPIVLLVAMLVGSAWAGIAGVLKVTRGVHEVISTIMLNNIVLTGLAAYLLRTYLEVKPDPSIANPVPQTATIPASGRFPSLNRVLDAVGIETRNIELWGFLIVAILAGIGYHYLVNRTRFGYDLRISGISPGAARAAGVDPKAMVVKTMLISGAVAGLVGMPHLLCYFFNYSIDFPTYLGFNGLSVALLGRNHPVGMAAGALLFGWFDRAAQILDLRNVPKEISRIMQGLILLSVVVVYEVVRRRIERMEVQAAAKAIAQAAVATGGAGGGGGEL
jgi:ABC-type uncharacterized transport system permease subunit